MYIQYRGWVRVELLVHAKLNIAALAAGVRALSV